MAEAWVSLLSHWPRQVRYGDAAYVAWPYRLVDENGGEVTLATATDTVTATCFDNSGSSIASPVTLSIVDGTALVNMTFNVSATGTYPLAENYRLVLTITDTSASRAYTREVFFHVVRQPLELEIGDSHIPSWLRPPKGETTHARAIQEAYGDAMGFMSMCVVTNNIGRFERLGDGVATAAAQAALLVRNRFALAPVEYRARPYMVFDRQHAQELIKAQAIYNAMMASMTNTGDAFATQADRQLVTISEKREYFAASLRLDWAQDGNDPGYDDNKPDIGRMRQ